jgi:hypothetical protein
LKETFVILYTKKILQVLKKLRGDEDDLVTGGEGLSKEEAKEAGDEGLIHLVAERLEELIIVIIAHLAFEDYHVDTVDNEVLGEVDTKEEQDGHVKVLRVGDSEVQDDDRHCEDQDS